MESWYCAKTSSYDLVCLWLPIGTLLLRAILDQATTPDLEILPLITSFSIVIGFSFMLAFTMLVNYIMGRKFEGIDMVASLKSIE